MRWPFLLCRTADRCGLLLVALSYGDNRVLTCGSEDIMSVGNIGNGIGFMEL